MRQGLSENTSSAPNGPRWSASQGVVADASVADESVADESAFPELQSASELRSTSSWRMYALFLIKALRKPMTAMIAAKKKRIS